MVNREDRLKNSIPVICMISTSPGAQIFQGYGILESAEVVTQYSEEYDCYFDNYLFTICIFSMRKDGEHALLFTAAKDTCNEFLSRNNIANPQNLYYVASCLFEGDYRFKRPHILSEDFPVQEISASNIAQILLHCDTDLNYEKYYRLAVALGWVGGTVYSIFSELEKDFVRVSENDYVRKNYFGMSQSLINSISDMLRGFVSKSGYFAFSSIFDYGSFPKCSYKWNGFLLESLITEYDTGFCIISPQIRDRRYQRGIIVPNDSTFDTFEDLVIGTLLSDGISTLTETELLKYLRMRGLIVTSTIPQELYECPKLPFRNEVFMVRK